MTTGGGKLSDYRIKTLRNEQGGEGAEKSRDEEMQAVLKRPLLNHLQSGLYRPEQETQSVRDFNSTQLKSVF